MAAFEGTAEFALFEAIAENLRQELGPEIEQQPGGPDQSNSGQVNRAYRVVVRIVLQSVVPPVEDLSAAVNVALDRLARRRLETCGLTHREIEHLIVHEAKGRDDWLAFFVLTDCEEIELLLQTSDPDDDPSSPA
ncbi:MAG: hypothetical protein P4L84_32820 [Isosphaeraceae bacterium]|nr:hypothetical protein [Isosphaeraceae bacterium]